MKAKISEKPPYNYRKNNLIDDFANKVKDMQEEMLKISLLRDKFRDQNWHDQDIAKYYR